MDIELKKASTYARLIQHPTNFHQPLIRRAQFLFCSLEDQHVRTRVAALCSAQYFLALGNHILVRAVTSYSDPDSLTTWWTSYSWSPRSGLFPAASDGQEKDRARFKAGEPSPSVPPSSSAKTSKTQSLSRPSAQSDLPRLQRRLSEELAMQSFCLSLCNVVLSSLLGISEVKQVGIAITERSSPYDIAASFMLELAVTSLI